MKKQLFDELIDSIKEAGRIHRGEIQSSREFVIDAQDVVHRKEAPTDSDTHG